MHSLQIRSYKNNQKKKPKKQLKFNTKSVKFLHIVKNVSKRTNSSLENWKKQLVLKKLELKLKTAFKKRNF